MLSGSKAVFCLAIVMGPQLRRSMRALCKIHGCAALSPSPHIFLLKRSVCVKSQLRNRRLIAAICGRVWQDITTIPTIAFGAGMMPGWLPSFEIGMCQRCLTISACRFWPFKGQTINMAHWRRLMNLHAAAARRLSGWFWQAVAMIPAMSGPIGC